MLAQVSRCRGAILSLAGVWAVTVSAVPARAGPPLASPPVASLPLVVWLGQEPTALAGPWQFHSGDNLKWADPQFDDADWEQKSANLTWARQGYFNYTGFAWYRLLVHFQQEGVPSADVALLIPRVDDAYELYWNGVRVARNGKFPPNPLWPLFSQPPQTFGLGTARDGVLAFRVWKAPLLSEDSGLRGGFEAPPLAGTPHAVTMHKALLDDQWLRGGLLYFGLNVLYGIIGVLTLIAWLRNREQWQLFWMSGFAITRIVEMAIYNLRLPIPLTVANALWQPFSAFRSVSLWFLLLWLLQLRQNSRLVRFTSICAWIAITTDTVDGLLCLFIWRPGWRIAIQIGDGVLTAVYTVTLMLPLVLVALAVTRRGGLNKTRWTVAICAFAAGMVEVIRNASPQGSRFTHWTFGSLFDAPLFTWDGNVVSIVTVTNTLLLLASALAVYRSFEENRRHQQGLELEFENARALQQVLIPEKPPDVLGFRVTSAYRPALEVGGDFFQIIPIESSGSTLVIVGDVSGKGLKAAMAVSFIMGTVLVLVERISSPAKLLAEMNERLLGRLQSGFTTCLALRIEPDGRCVIAGAGHPSPFVGDREVQIISGFPLGLFPGVAYEEVELILQPGETCMLYTDGLTEARDKSGEIFGEERLAKLFAIWPTAQQAADAAIQFGQDDDVTVVSLTRLKGDTVAAPSGAAESVHSTTMAAGYTSAA